MEIRKGRVIDNLAHPAQILGLRGGKPHRSNHAFYIRDLHSSDDCISKESFEVASLSTHTCTPACENVGMYNLL